MSNQTRCEEKSELQLVLEAELRALRDPQLKEQLEEVNAALLKDAKP